MRDVIKKMIEKILEIHPDMSYMFLESATCKNEWHPEFKFSKIGLKEKPELELLDVNFDKNKFCGPIVNGKLNQPGKDFCRNRNDREKGFFLLITGQTALYSEI